MGKWGKGRARWALGSAVTCSSTEHTRSTGSGRWESSLSVHRRDGRCLTKGTPPLLKGTHSKGRLRLGNRYSGNQGRLSRGELHTSKSFFPVSRTMAALSKESEFNNPEYFLTKGQKPITSSSKKTSRLMRPVRWMPAPLLQSSGFLPACIVLRL